MSQIQEIYALFKMFFVKINLHLSQRADVNGTVLVKHVCPTKSQGSTSKL